MCLGIQIPSICERIPDTLFWHSWQRRSAATTTSPSCSFCFPPKNKHHQRIKLFFTSRKNSRRIWGEIRTSEADKDLESVNLLLGWEIKNFLFFCIPIRASSFFTQEITRLIIMLTWGRTGQGRASRQQHFVEIWELMVVCIYICIYIYLAI